METRGFMGGLYRISEWIMRFSVINLLWLLCSLPVFYLLLVALHSPSVENFYITLILIMIISPFLLFPATSAMFVVARKWTMGEEDVPLFKTFFRGYKENYRQSMLGGIIFLLLGVVLFINYRFYIGLPNALQYISYLFISLFLIVAISFVNFFSIIVHYQMKLFQSIKNSFLISIVHPVRSLTLLISNLFIVYVSFWHFTFLIPFFMGSIIAYISFWHFYRMFQNLQAKQEQLRQSQLEDAGAGEENENRLERP